MNPKEFERWEHLASVADLVGGKVTADSLIVHGFLGEPNDYRSSIAAKVQGNYAGHAVCWHSEWGTMTLALQYVTFHSVQLDLTPHGEPWTITHDAAAPDGWLFTQAPEALHTRLLQAQVFKPIQETMMPHFPFPERGKPLGRHEGVTACRFRFMAHDSALICEMDYTGKSQGPSSDQARAMFACLLALARIDAAVNTEIPPERRLWPWRHPRTEGSE